MRFMILFTFALILIMAVVTEAGRPGRPSGPKPVKPIRPVPRPVNPHPRVRREYPAGGEQLPDSPVQDFPEFLPY